MADDTWIVEDPEYTIFTRINGTTELIDIVGELTETSYSSTINKTDISSVTVATTVTSIGYGAFSEATRLTSITFAENSQLTRRSSMRQV